MPLRNAQKKLAEASFFRYRKLFAGILDVCLSAPLWGDAAQANQKRNLRKADSFFIPLIYFLGFLMFACPGYSLRG